MKLYRLGVLAFWLLLSPQAFPQVSVGSSGLASTTYPIKVPPGIAGMVPQLSLAYSSTTTSGPVGVGWSIQGLSVITRCSTNYALDGVRRGVQFTNADRFCWDGQRLIQTDANGTPTDQSTYGAAGTEYRTEIDGIARIRAYGSTGGSAANGPDHFKVWTKSGQLMTFGATSDSKPMVQGKPQVSAWLISKTTDAKSNYIDFVYNNDPAKAWGTGENMNSPRPGLESTIREIRYTGNGAQLPANSVLFEYGNGFGAPDARLDARESYHQGSKMVDTKLLQKISTRINGSSNNVTSLIHFYYDQNSVTRRVRLRSLKECVASNKCLPETIFSYSGRSDNAFDLVSNLTFSGIDTLQNAAAGYGVLLGDFNGDGRTDLLRWSNANPSNNKLLLNSIDVDNASYSFSDTPSFGIVDQLLFDVPGCKFTLAADFNSDGITDLLRWASPGGSNWSGTGVCTASGATLLYLGRASGQFAAPADLSSMQLRRDHVVQSNYIKASSFFVGDYDGDGLADILAATSETTVGQQTNYLNRLWKNDGNGFFFLANPGNTPIGVYADLMRSPGVGVQVFSDYNGDGLADICDDGRLYVSQGDGSFVGRPHSLCARNGRRMVDLNGDGKIDYFNDSGNISISIDDYLTINHGPAANGLGNAFYNSVDPTSAGSIVSDFNADGLTDILRWSNDPTQNRLYLSDGRGIFLPAYGFNINQVNDLLKHGDSSVDAYVGDFTGRGLTEIITLGARPVGGTQTSFNKLYTKSLSPRAAAFAAQPDLLISVKSSLGALTEVSYRTLAETSSLYEANRVGVSYPDVVIRPAQAVVERVTSDVGLIGPRNVTEYRYTNLKVNMRGRGMLGFSSVTSTSQGAETANTANNYITSVTDYRQDYPFVGMPSRQRSYVGPKFTTTGAPLKDGTTSYCDRAVRVGSCPESATTAGLTPRKPYAYQTSETSYDLDSSPLPSVTTTNLYDEWLNSTQVAITTSGAYANAGSRSFTKVVNNAYKPANIAGDNWILGRLSRASVSNTAPDSAASDLLATSYGSAANANSTQGSGGSVMTPDQVASIMAVITLLLED